MHKVELDQRIVGLSIQKITKPFVRNNLTHAELKEPHYKTDYGWRSKTWNSINNTDSTLLLSEIIKFIEELPSDSRHHLTSYRNSISLEYTVSHKVQVDSVDFYYEKWRNDLKAHKAAEAEYARYMELKAKFGD